MNKIPKTEEFTAIDFTKYTKQGFLITPEKYTGNYESIGIIDFVYMPQANLNTNYISNNYSWKEETNLVVGQAWNIDKVNVQDAIEGIYNRCVDMGANALVSFSITAVTKDYLAIKNPVVIPGYRITGFAIKTK
ncbi:MAG: hypothetical protein JZU49_00085 [Sulfuricurvum sp.]|nr:hypothetical protein [Sulfuricurvum sp.]